MKPTPMDALAPDRCVCDWPICACPPAERALRSLQHQTGQPLMNDEQREWCRREIEQVEGYSRADYEGADDADLAHGVLSAWTDYCRDKGML